MTLTSPGTDLNGEIDVLELGRSHLVAWVSADLRRPLRGLQDLVESIDAEVAADPSQLHQHRVRMLRQIHRLSELLDDLAVLARPDQAGMAAVGPSDPEGDFDLAYQGSVPASDTPQ
jgi:signal transduction histidine kinase